MGKRRRRQKRKSILAKYEGKSGYKLRDTILKDMGFFSYKEYLSSDLWQNIRSKILHIYEYKCHCCYKKANQVHHQWYNPENLSGEKIYENGLMALCRDCHYNAEFEDNQKSPISKVRSKVEQKHNNLPKYKKCRSGTRIGKRMSAANRFLKESEENRKFHEEQEKRWRS